MRESIHKYFRVGTLQWMSHPKREVVQSVRDLANNAFLDAVEIAHIADPEKRRQVRDILRQSHMMVGYGAQPIQLAGNLNPNAVDEAERQKCEKALLEALDEAAYLGAEGFAFMAGKWSVEQVEACLSQLVKTTRNICDAAKRYGIKVELEVFDYDMDKAVLIGPAPLAARYASEVRKTHPEFGLLVDLSHIPTTHEKSDEVIHALKPWITHLHIGNAVVIPGCEAYGDKHPPFGFPNSENDTPELLNFFRSLKAEGFFDAENPLILSSEVKPWGDQEEDLILTNTQRVIQRAWAMLED